MTHFLPFGVLLCRQDFPDLLFLLGSSFLHLLHIVLFHCRTFTRSSHRRTTASHTGSHSTFHRRTTTVPSGTTSHQRTLTISVYIFYRTACLSVAVLLSSGPSFSGQLSPVKELHGAIVSSPAPVLVYKPAHTTDIQLITIIFRYFSFYVSFLLRCKCKGEKEELKIKSTKGKVLSTE